jgi:hypothetical protein
MNLSDLICFNGQVAVKEAARSVVALLQGATPSSAAASTSAVPAALPPPPKTKAASADGPLLDLLGGDPISVTTPSTTATTAAAATAPDLFTGLEVGSAPAVPPMAAACSSSSSTPASIPAPATAADDLLGGLAGLSVNTAAAADSAHMTQSLMNGGDVVEAAATAAKPMGAPRATAGGAGMPPAPNAATTYDGMMQPQMMQPQMMQPQMMGQMGMMPPVPYGTCFGI